MATDAEPAARASLSAEPQPDTPIWRYASAFLGMSIPINMIRGSMLLYYVDLHGLDARAYGVVMTVYAILDAIDNPVLGWFSDRTRTRFGRRRPWLLVGATVLAACFVGFFSAPDDLSGLGLVAWFTFFALTCEAADSMLGANYGALLPEVYPAERRRASANAARQGAQLIGMVVSLALTPMLATQVLGSQETTIGFTRTALIYAVIAWVVIAFMVVSVRENPHHAESTKPAFFGSIWDIVRTRLFWQIGIASACYLIPLAMLLAGVQLYVKYALGLPVGDALWIQLVVIVLAGVGLATWAQVIRRVGAPKVWRAAFIVLAVGFVPLYFANSLVTTMAAGAVIAVGWSGLMSTNDLIQARMLDEDARRTGLHREGIYLAAFGFFGRLSGMVNGLAVSSLGYLFGYYSGDDPGPDPGAAFRFYMSICPLAVALIGVVLSRIIKVPDANREVIV